MGLYSPWAAGFLCNILIRYLERNSPSLEKQINYTRLLAQAWSSPNSPGDPKTFIRDTNRWLPQGILKELIRIGERLTRRKDLAYHATLDYFTPGANDLPSVFELIAEMIDDMETTLALCGYWATIFTNYLKLQACMAVSGPGREVVVLCRFEDFVHPCLANCQFVQGHLEGFPRLYPYVEQCRCEEEFSQLRLEDLAAEFGGHAAEGTSDGLLLREIRSGRAVVEAEAVELAAEDLRQLRCGRFAFSPLPIITPVEDRVRVLTARPEARRAQEDGESDVANRVFRIRRGGVLKSGGAAFELEEGRLFNAPYTRYRLVWKEKDDLSVRDRESHSERIRAGHLLNHLNAIKESQIRLLQFTAENQGLEHENRYLRKTVQEDYRFGRLIGKSPAMQELFSLLQTLSELDTTVLIMGETGTGKELVARAIHFNSSRKNRRFVAINCGAMTESLLDSELFGYERGAFTGAFSRHEGKFEQADEGTLFLDEVGEISPAMQVKLLRVLEGGEVQRIGGKQAIRVDVRIIAATHQDLRGLMEQGRFRRDLYYRLHVVDVRPPPLRERREDIPLLAGHFLTELNRRLKRQARGISSEAMACLLGYGWPGNVRELAHVIERAVVLSDPDSWILPENLPSEVRAKREGATGLEGPGLLEIMDRLAWDLFHHSLEKQGSLSNLIKAVEARIVKKAVREFDGNKTRAARALKRSYRWLRKLEKQSGS